MPDSNCSEANRSSAANPNDDTALKATTPDNQMSIGIHIAKPELINVESADVNSKTFVSLAEKLFGGTAAVTTAATAAATTSATDAATVDRLAMAMKLAQAAPPHTSSSASSTTIPTSASSKRLLVPPKITNSSLCRLLGSLTGTPSSPAQLKSILEG
ncbi:unnamed protein product, partial [Dibothriocephalus latus]